MDFLDLVLKGYTNKNNREFLDKYFYREFKKAEKEHYFEPEEFFKGCFDIVESFKEELQNKVWERKEELLMMLERARSKTIKYADLQGKTIEEKRKETIEYCKNELASETTYSIGSIGFTVHLMSKTNDRYLGSLYNHEVEFIETNIIKANIRVLKEISITLETSQQKTKEKEPEMSLIEKTADWRFFQIEVNADMEVDGKIYKNVRQKNNDSILNPDNWNRHKETFFNQRMDKYKKSYTNEEKIKLELEALEKLTINNIDYKILRDRYIEYLKSDVDINDTNFNIERSNSNVVNSKNSIQEKTQSLSDKIETYFTFFLDDCPSKEKPILENEEDFKNLIKWTTYFFENKFKVPEIKQPIRNVNTNKYITQLAFQILFDELRKDSFHNKTTKSKKLFTLWESIFLEYKGYNESNFWKVKKKNENGEDYDDQVKRLMGL